MPFSVTSLLRRMNEGGGGEPAGTGVWPWPPNRFGFRAVSANGFLGGAALVLLRFGSFVSTQYASLLTRRVRKFLAFSVDKHLLGNERVCCLLGIRFLLLPSTLCLPYGTAVTDEQEEQSQGDRCIRRGFALLGNWRHKTRLIAI